MNKTFFTFFLFLFLTSCPMEHGTDFEKEIIALTNPVSEDGPSLYGSIDLELTELYDQNQECRDQFKYTCCLCSIAAAPMLGTLAVALLLSYL